jgi:hypothetical protein
LFFLARASSRPPKEAKLLRNFYEHRAAFEHLRDMLLADSNVCRVADWGVETVKPSGIGMPSEGVFPHARFNEYLEWLKQAHGLMAVRSEGSNADPGIMVWAWGFAGNTRHVGICWLDQPPANQIATLDGYAGQSHYPNRVVAHRHIDSNWYLWTDL